jgi:AraC-type transcriptional regulator N-terminus
LHRGHSGEKYDQSFCGTPRRITSPYPYCPACTSCGFGWSSRPLVGMQSPCMTLVIQGAKSLDFGPTHLEYGAGKCLLTPIDMRVTCRIVGATSKNPLLAVAIEIDFEELKRLVRRCDTLPSSSPLPGIDVFKADSDLLEAVVRLLRLLDTPDGGIRWTARNVRIICGSTGAPCVPWRAPQATSSNRLQCGEVRVRSQFEPASHQ